MTSGTPELLNSVYSELSEKFGMDTTLELYRMFKGQQISFPVKFFDPKVIRKSVAEEYNGSNIRQLAMKYDYSEKTIRRIVKNYPRQQNELPHTNNRKD